MERQKLLDEGINGLRQSLAGKEVVERDKILKRLEGDMEAELARAHEACFQETEGLFNQRMLDFRTEVDKRFEAEKSDKIKEMKIKIRGDYEAKNQALRVEMAERERLLSLDLDRKLSIELFCSSHGSIRNITYHISMTTP